MNVVFPAPVIPITAITMSFGLSDVNFRYSDGRAQRRFYLRRRLAVLRRLVGVGRRIKKFVQKFAHRDRLISD